MLLREDALTQLGCILLEAVLNLMVADCDEAQSKKSKMQLV